MFDFMSRVRTGLCQVLPYRKTKAAVLATITSPEFSLTAAAGEQIDKEIYDV